MSPTKQTTSSSDKTIGEIVEDDYRTAGIFDKIAIDMATHLREEEDVFFPVVKRADTIRRTSATPEAQDIKTIRTSLKKLSYEHEEIGDAVHKIRALPRNIRYQVMSAIHSCSPTRNSVSSRMTPINMCTLKTTFSSRRRRSSRENQN